MPSFAFSSLCFLLLLHSLPTRRSSDLGTASPQPWAYQDSLSWWVPSPYGSSQQSKRLWCHDHWHFLAWVWWKNYAKPPSILVRLSAHGLQGLTRAVTWHGQRHY